MTLDTLTQQEYDAALARVAAYRDQLERADKQADQNSLDRAADLELIYQAMRWVDEVPAPKNTVWRGRPVDPRSRNRFAGWALQKTGLNPSRVRQLHNANEMVAALIDTGVSVIPAGEGAVRPLYRLRRTGYGNRIGDVYKIAVQLAEGQPPTVAETRQAVRDFLAQYTVTQRRETKSKDWLEQRRQAIIRDFGILLEMEQYATAEQVLNEQLAAYRAHVPQDMQ